MLIIVLQHGKIRNTERPRTLKVRAAVIGYSLRWLRDHSPAYDGSDPQFPRIEIDDEVLAKLPQAQEGGFVDWRELVIAATDNDPHYRGVPAADIGDDDAGEPASESGVLRDFDANTDQEELLKQLLDCAAAGETLEWPRRGEKN